MWQAQYKPRYVPVLSSFVPGLGYTDGSYLRRNRIPWIIIGVCYLSCAILLLIIRWLLARENAQRDTEPIEDDDAFFLEKVSEDGTRVQVQVNKVRCRSPTAIGMITQCLAGVRGLDGPTESGFQIRALGDRSSTRMMAVGFREAVTITYTHSFRWT